MQAVEELPESVQKELAVKSETVTPMWWAIWVLFKVGCLAVIHRSGTISSTLGHRLVQASPYITTTLSISNYHLVVPSLYRSTT